MVVCVLRMVSDEANKVYAAAVEPMLRIPSSQLDMSTAVSLGKGGMGLTYRVTLFGTPVCVKVVYIAIASSIK